MIIEMVEPFSKSRRDDIFHSDMPPLRGLDNLLLSKSIIIALLRSGGEADICYWISALINLSDDINASDVAGH